MTTRQYFYAEDLANTNNTNGGVYTDKATITFTGDANSDYVLFWSAKIRQSIVTEDVNCRVFDGTNSYDDIVIRPHEVGSPVDKWAVGSFFRVQNGASPVPKTFTIQFKRGAASGTASCEDTRITVLKLTANAVYAESTTRITTTSTTLAAALTTAAIPAGAYILLGSMIVDITASGANANSTKLFWNGTTNGTVAEWGYTPTATSNRYPSTMIADITSTGGTAQISYRASTGGTAGIASMKLLALLKSDFDFVYAVVSAGQQTTTSTTYVDSSNTSQTFTPAAHPHFTIAGFSASGNSTTISSQAQLLDGGTAFGEHTFEPQSNNNATAEMPAMTQRVATYPNTSRTQVIQMLAETSSTITRVRSSSAIVSFDLGQQGGVLSSTGQGVATFVGRKITTAVLASAGVGAAAFVSQAIKGVVAAMAGVGAAAFNAKAVFRTVLSASGIGAAAFVSQAVKGTAMTSAGQGVATFRSAAVKGAALNASGTGLFVARMVDGNVSPGSGGNTKAPRWIASLGKFMNRG